MQLTNEMREFLRDQGYYGVKEIDGVICALHNYMYTCAIVVDVHSLGYERRYCYPDVLMAADALASFVDTTQHAPGEWIKCKGRFDGEPVDMLNPNMVKD